MKFLLKEVFNDDKFAFHVTPTRNVKSILKNGLRPQDSGIGDEKGVYLFRDKLSLQDALMNWLGDKFEDDEKLALLKIDLSKFYSTIGSDVEYEIRIKETVPPTAITVEDYNI